MVSAQVGEQIQFLVDERHPLFLGNAALSAAFTKRGVLNTLEGDPRFYFDDSPADLPIPSTVRF